MSSTDYFVMSAECHALTERVSVQVHWLRVIVDEGHMIGNSLYMTNKLQMACALRAERRWLMTGTPTPGGPNSDTAHLQPLLAFLHNEPYGTEPSVWQV